MAEEGTQKQVLEEVKKLSSVDADTDKSGITNTKNFAETEGYEAMNEANKDLGKYATGENKSGEVEEKKGIFQEAMESGFWTPIPEVACEPPEFSVAGHALNLSGWCGVVEKIRTIGAYALWVILAISVFVMLTGGRQS